MKKTILPIALILFVVHLYGQDTLEYEFGKFYYEARNIVINSLQYKCVNEDAFRETRKRLRERKSPNVFKYGFIKEVDIPLFKKATKVKHNDGSQSYYLHVKGLGIDMVELIVSIDVPNAVSIQTFQKDGELYQTIRNSLKDGEGFWMMMYGSDMIIKATIPKGVKKKHLNFNITSLMFSFHKDQDLGVKVPGQPLYLKSTACNNYVSCKTRNEPCRNGYYSF